jgi:hypothetical protein
MAARSKAKSKTDDADLKKAVDLLTKRITDMKRPFGLVLPQWGYTRREMGYCGKQYDPGQLVELQGVRGDEKLFRIGYIKDLPANFDLEQDPIQCGLCGERFLNPHYLELHGDKRHAQQCECGFTAAYPMEFEEHTARCEVRRKARRKLYPEVE